MASLLWPVLISDPYGFLIIDYDLSVLISGPHGLFIGLAKFVYLRNIFRDVLGSVRQVHPEASHGLFPD